MINRLAAAYYKDSAIVERNSDSDNQLTPATCELAESNGKNRGIFPAPPNLKAEEFRLPEGHVHQMFGDEVMNLLGGCVA